MNKKIPNKRRVPNNRNVSNTGRILQSGKSIGQGIYGIYIFFFCLIYGFFFYYFNHNVDGIVRGFANFTLTEELKVFLVLCILCVLIWFILLAATVWRGRDIGFLKWQSILLYCIPPAPRFLVLLFNWKWLDPWAEIIASILWLIIAGIFLYLPTGWAYRKLQGKKV